MAAHQRLAHIASNARIEVRENAFRACPALVQLGTPKTKKPGVNTWLVVGISLTAKGYQPEGVTLWLILFNETRRVFFSKEPPKIISKLSVIIV